MSSVWNHFLRRLTVGFVHSSGKYFLPSQNSDGGMCKVPTPCSADSVAGTKKEVTWEGTRKCCITFHCFNCPWSHPLAKVSIQMPCFVCRAHDIIATTLHLFLEMCRRRRRPFHATTSESVEEYDARDVIVGLSSRTWRKLWLVRERSCNFPEIHHCRVDALCLMFRSWHGQQLTVRTFQFANSL